jgi:hypothetical protein
MDLRMTIWGCSRRDSSMSWSCSSWSSNNLYRFRFKINRRRRNLLSKFRNKSCLCSRLCRFREMKLIIRRVILSYRSCSFSFFKIKCKDRIKKVNKNKVWLLLKEEIVTDLLCKLILLYKETKKWHKVEAIKK